MKTVKCSRCRRRMRSHANWSVVTEWGHVTEVLCPACQTVVEHVEADVNEATSVAIFASDGRIGLAPKLEEEI